MHNAFVEVFCFVFLVFDRLAVTTSGFLSVFFSLFLEGVWFGSLVLVRFGVYAFGENVWWECCNSS